MPETELLVLDSTFSVNSMLWTVCVMLGNQYHDLLQGYQACKLLSAIAPHAWCQMMQRFSMRTKTKQNFSPVLSTALPKASREVRESNTSWSCWELKTEADQIITQGKEGETTEKQDETGTENCLHNSTYSFRNMTCVCQV